LSIKLRKKSAVRKTMGARFRPCPLFFAINCFCRFYLKNRTVSVMVSDAPGSKVQIQMPGPDSQPDFGTVGALLVTAG
jgi:hypothetical protein